jgi:hypothetical protein
MTCDQAGTLRQPGPLGAVAQIFLLHGPKPQYV